MFTEIKNRLAKIPTMTKEELKIRLVEIKTYQLSQMKVLGDDKLPQMDEIESMAILAELFPINDEKISINDMLANIISLRDEIDKLAKENVK